MNEFGPEAVPTTRAGVVLDFASSELFSRTFQDGMELVDPQVAPETLLYRLFHEDGVRMFAPKPLRAFCRCSDERVLGMLTAFPPEDRADMVEADGHIRVTCEYCSKVYDVAPEKIVDES